MYLKTKSHLDKVKFISKTKPSLPGRGSKNKSPTEGGNKVWVDTHFKVSIIQEYADFCLEQILKLTTKRFSSPSIFLK